MLKKAAKLSNSIFIIIASLTKFQLGKNISNYFGNIVCILQFNNVYYQNFIFILKNCTILIT